MMENLGWLEKVSYYIDKIARIFLVILMAVMVLDVLVGVANRFIFHFPFSWSEEIARYLLIWASSIGTAIALRSGSHVGVVFILERLKKSKNWVIIIFQIIMLIFFLVVAVYGIKLCISQRGQGGPVTQISMFWPFFSIPFGSSMMVVHLLPQIKLTFRSLLNQYKIER